MGAQTDLSEIGGQLGLGVVLGFAVGYTARKALRVLLIALGVVVLCQILLERYGIVSVHWETIERAYNDTVSRTGDLKELLRSWAESISRYLPVAGSFMLGFALGFRKG